MLDTGLTFNNNEIVAMHHPIHRDVAWKARRDRHALYIWAI